MTITRTWSVTGMTCSHCVRAVEQEVGALTDVTDVHVDLTSGDVTVCSTRALDDAEVAAALYEAGYDLAS
jgi:copper ion binding protein